jgi:CelD/BcsL family acetyltransferase involved in cellulose biosynthesis
MKLSLRAYENLDELIALRATWDELLSRYPAATTFSTWEWLSCWWRCFGKNQQLLVLAMFDSGSLVGLAPFSISREHEGWFSLRVVRLMGDGSGDSDNLDLPVRPGFERAFAEAILQELRQRRREWDVCRLNTLPPDSLVAGCLAQALRSSSWTFFEGSSKSSAVPLPESWELYTQALSSEDRKNLARYTRRLQLRHNTRIYRCGERDELPTCLEALFRLHQGRWVSAGESGSFSSTQRREFYAQLSPLLLDRGWLELWALELDGEIAAVQFAFRYREKVFQLQEGYDHERTSDRLGYVLRGEVLKQLISEKVRTYDFLGGQDPYKARWGAQQGHYRQIHFARSLGIGAAWLQFVDMATRSKEWLRCRLPSSAWRSLHKAHLVVKGTLRSSSENNPKFPE